MVKYGFLFPGQGAQFPGMMKDLCGSFADGKNFLDDYSKIVGFSVQELLWESSEQELSRTDKSQTAITAASLLAVEFLKSQNITPSFAAGFSLGEWVALKVSEVLSFEEIVYIVKRRGEIMQEVCESIASASTNPPGMAAVLGLDGKTVQSVLNGRNDVFAANLNSSQQTVISGTYDGLKWAEENLKNAGAKRIIPLKVAGPFHSPLMMDAAEKFSKVLDSITFKKPQIPIFSNVTGSRISTGEEIKQNAVKHIISPVLWVDEENSIHNFCTNTDEWKLVEVGPGKVLAGLWGKTEFVQQIPCVSWEEIKS